MSQYAFSRLGHSRLSYSRTTHEYCHSKVHFKQCAWSAECFLLIADKLALPESDIPKEQEMVTAANDASSGQVKKGSNNNPEEAPDATWWLRDVNVSVGPGELVCVVGRVGSGKSSLIGALLGESNPPSLYFVISLVAC